MKMSSPWPNAGHWGQPQHSHDGDALGVDGRKVGILQQAHLGTEAHTHAHHDWGSRRLAGQVSTAVCSQPRHPGAQDQPHTAAALGLMAPQPPQLQQHRGDSRCCRGEHYLLSLDTASARSMQGGPSPPAHRPSPPAHRPQQSWPPPVPLPSTHTPTPLHSGPPTHQVGLSGLLQRLDCLGLPAVLCGAAGAGVGLLCDVVADLAHQALERQLADEQLRGLLVLANLTAVAVGRGEGGGAPVCGVVSPVCVLHQLTSARMHSARTCSVCTRQAAKETRAFPVAPWTCRTGRDAPRRAPPGAEVRNNAARLWLPWAASSDKCTSP